MKVIGLGVVVALFGAVGCGSSGSSGPAATTYPLADLSTGVDAGDCQLIAGPYSVGNGSMSFTVTDIQGALGADDMEAAILPDSIWTSQGCSNFTHSETVVDDTFEGDDSGTGPVEADTYDFIVSCQNSVQDCQFTLNWTATY